MNVKSLRHETSHEIIEPSDFKVAAKHTAKQLLKKSMNLWKTSLSRNFTLKIRKNAHFDENNSGFFHDEAFFKFNPEMERSFQKNTNLADIKLKKPKTSKPLRNTVDETPFVVGFI